MSRLLRLGEGADVKAGAAAAAFAWPVNENSAGGVDITGWTSGRGRPPDVIVSLLANGQCAFDKAAGIVGLRPDGGLSLLEGPLFGGGIVQFADANIARDFAVAVGGYKKLWLVAFDGSVLGVTNGKTVVASFIPAYSAEG
jgi:hypothetical protein